MRQRIMLFLSPDSDPLGAGYNMIQARISIGSGGWWGRGLGEGTQTQLSFLRVRHTDFIFAVVGEELGFFGAVGVLVAYAWLILRCLAAVTSTTDVFGRLLATGVATMLLFEIFVNVGVNLGLVPVAGIPLPFLSYGRSALLANFLALGLVQSGAPLRTPAALRLRTGGATAIGRRDCAAPDNRRSATESKTDGERREDDRQRQRASGHIGSAGVHVQSGAGLRYARHGARSVQRGDAAGWAYRRRQRG